MTEGSPAYRYEDVIAILIDGMSEFIYIKKGSLQDGEVSYESPLIQGEFRSEKTITAIDQFDGSKIFLFASRLAAIKSEPADLKVVEGGVSNLTRTLP